MSPLPADDAPAPGPLGHFSRRSLLRYGLGLGLGATLAPSLLAACSDDNGGNPAAPAKGVEGVDPLQLGEETPGVVYADDYVGPRARTIKPFADGSKTFTVVVPVDTTSVGDWNKNAYTDFMKEKTGLDVTFKTVTTSGPNGTDMTKVNAMLASGDLPDAFLGIPFTRDQISLYGSQGVFTPLDDLIQTYAPQVRAAFDDYPDMRTLSKAKDGNTYAFPTLNDCYHCRVSPGRAFIYKPWLDQLGLEIPQTTEELRTVLKAFKDNDVTGHGDAIPFAAGADNPIDRYFMGSFLYNPGEPWLRLDGEKVDFVANKPEWREGLKYLRTLSDDGLLTNDAFSMTGEALTRLGNNPGYNRLGFVRAYYWGSFIDITYNGGGKDRWRDFVPVLPLKGPDGTQIAAWGNYTVPGTGMLVTSKVENPELLVQWADHQMELESTIFGYAGVPKKNWNWAKEGDNGINGKQAVYAIDEWPAPTGTSWGQYSMMYRSNDFRLSQYADPKNPNFEKDLYEASVPYSDFASDKAWELPPLIFDESQAAQNADIATSISNAVKQSLAEFAVGKRDINDDATWDKYVQDLDKRGLPNYLQNYQQAYDDRPKG